MTTTCKHSRHSVHFWAGLPVFGQREYAQVPSFEHLHDHPCLVFSTQRSCPKAKTPSSEIEPEIPQTSCNTVSRIKPSVLSLILLITQSSANNRLLK